MGGGGDADSADAGDGGYDVVDWKTGDPPASQTGRRAAAVQLAAYRLAWSRLAGVPAGQVRAAFYYVRQDLTLRPAGLPGGQEKSQPARAAGPPAEEGRPAAGL